MIIYGTDLCKDCLACKEKLARSAVSYEYRDISTNIQYLKEFLKLRDTFSVFDEVKAQGFIGVPAIVCDDGAVLLSWETFL